MRRAARFAIALVIGLAIVTAVASWLVHRTTRGWFERDLQLRAQLAVNGMRAALLPHWSMGSTPQLRVRLLELTRDERIMAAAACSADHLMLASTEKFPTGIYCDELAPHVEVGTQAMPSSWSPAVTLDA
jgi:trehalose 6-phosphate synthase